MIPKEGSKLKKYIHGSLEDQLTSEVKNNINNIMKKMTKEDEFEFMFFNYKKGVNLMGFENFLKVLEYVNYRSRVKKIKLKKHTTLDIIYGDDSNLEDQDTVRTVFRISINKLKNINKYMEMLHRRKNHIIFSMLVFI